MNTGKFYVTKGGRTFLVEPISKNAERGADWGHGDLSNRPIGGACHPDDSVISDETHKNIVTLDPGVSPLGYIDQLLNEGEREDG